MIFIAVPQYVSHTMRFVLQAFFSNQRSKMSDCKIMKGLTWLYLVNTVRDKGELCQREFSARVEVVTRPSSCYRRSVLSVSHGGDLGQLGHHLGHLGQLDRP